MFVRMLMLSLLLPSADSMSSPALLDMNASAASVGVLASPIPLRATPKDQLASTSYDHHQLLRVQRDFGDPWRDIVVDAWMPKSGAGELTEVRLWWVESNQNDIRKPFGKKTKKKVSVDYDQRGPNAWDITFGAGGRKFRFNAELDAQGRPAVFGDVRVGRKTVTHCRVDSAHLFAKKILDVTIGLDRLEVSCVDDQGKRHAGELRPSR